MKLKNGEKLDNYDEVKLNDDGQVVARNLWVTKYRSGLVKSKRIQRTNRSVKTLFGNFTTALLVD